MKFPAGFCLIAFQLLTQCEERRESVEAALHHYDQLIFSMNADSIAMCFTPEGRLGGEGMPMRVGRDSIRVFLHKFDQMGIELIANESVALSVEYSGDTTIQRGTYRQTARVAPNEPGTYRGRFEARWVPAENGHWQLASMYTWPEVAK